MNEKESERRREREDKGRAIVLFLAPPQKAPWQAVNQTGSLD